jgi:hypothetical protein
MPLGMAWPTFQCLKEGYSIFLGTLQPLKPQLVTAWLIAANSSPAHFICLSFLLLKIHSPGFPALSMVNYPDNILNAQAFSPLIEMLNGFF